MRRRLGRIIVQPTFKSINLISGNTDIGKTGKALAAGGKVVNFKGKLYVDLDLYKQQVKGSVALGTTKIPKDGIPIRVAFNPNKMIPNYSTLQEKYKPPDLEKIFPSKISQIKTRLPSLDMPDQELDKTSRKIEAQRGTYFFDTESGPYCVVKIAQWAEPGQAGFIELRKNTYTRVKSSAGNYKLVLEGMISIAPHELEDSVKEEVSRIKTIKEFLGENWEKTYRNLYWNKMDINPDFEMPSSVQSSYQQLLDEFKPHQVKKISVLDCAPKRGEAESGNPKPLIGPLLTGAITLRLWEYGVPTSEVITYDGP